MTHKAVRMGLVVTGGTIGPLEKDGLLVIDLTDKSADNARQTFVKSWPGPQKLDLYTRTPVQKLSESITPDDWVRIANAVRELVEVERCRSVVVLHGTDTAHYTSAALSFLLTDVDATVVVTGSNLALSEVNTDARTNVRDATAASRSLPRGVYFSFSGVSGEPSDVFLGTAFRKVRADGHGYVSLNHGPVATVTEGDVDLIVELVVPESREVTSEVSDAVAMIQLYPGIDLEMFADALIASAKRGVVVVLFSSGTGAENQGSDSLRRFAVRCHDAGIVLVLTVEHFASIESTFRSRIAAEQQGALYAADMTPETAFVKLCWALGQHQELDAVKQLVATPIAGESRVLTTSAVG